MTKEYRSKNKDKLSTNKIPILKYIKDIKELAVKLKYTYLKDKLLFSISKPF